MAGAAGRAAGVAATPGAAGRVAGVAATPGASYGTLWGSTPAPLAAGVVAVVG